MGTLQLALIFAAPKERVHVRACTHVCVCVCLERWQRSRFPGTLTNGLVAPLGVRACCCDTGSGAGFAHIPDVPGKGLWAFHSFGILVLLREISKHSFIPLGSHSTN